MRFIEVEKDGKVIYSIQENPAHNLKFQIEQVKKRLGLTPGQDYAIFVTRSSVGEQDFGKAFKRINGTHVIFKPLI